MNKIAVKNVGKTKLHLESGIINRNQIGIATPAEYSTFAGFLELVQKPVQKDSGITKK